MKRASIAITPTLRSVGLSNLSRDGRTTRVKTGRRRPPRIVLVVACSQRKRTSPPAELRLSSIEAAPEERAVQWRRRLHEVPATPQHAQDLYMGDHWSAACKAYILAKRYSSRAEL